MRRQDGSRTVNQGNPGVAIWRDEWLPASETFIMNQVRALTRYQPLLLGLRNRPTGLPIQPDRAPFSTSLAGRVALRAATRSQFRFIYDGKLRRADVRLIHAHFGPDAITVLPLARRLRLPLVATFHGFDVTSAPRRAGQQGAAYVAALRCVFDYADQLIAVSEFVRGQLLELGAPPAKVVVSPIGIPVSVAPAGATDRIARSGITFVGRLVDKKGVADLLDAAAALPAGSLDGETIRIVGFGPQEASLKRHAARCGLDVKFLGQRNPAYITALLARSRIFCAPSKTAENGDAEGFGMVFLEAAAQGVPVLAYRHGGVPEAVIDGQTGLLAPENDVRQLSMNLLRLLRHPNYAQSLGAAGRQRVNNDFNIEFRTAQLERLYDQATSSTGQK